MPNNLTPTQRDMLQLLANARTPLSATNLLPYVGEHHNTPQGVTQTAASLVRRGLATKLRLSGEVHYMPTASGREVLAALASLDKQAQR